MDVCGGGWEGWRWSERASEEAGDFESRRARAHRTVSAPGHADCESGLSERRNAKPDDVLTPFTLPPRLFVAAQIVPILAFWAFQQSLDLVQWLRRGMEPKKSSRRRLAEAYGASIAQEFNKEDKDGKNKGESAKVRRSPSNPNPKTRLAAAAPLLLRNPSSLSHKADGYLRRHQ